MSERVRGCVGVGWDRVPSISDGEGIGCPGKNIWCMNSRTVVGGFGRRRLLFVVLAIFMVAGGWVGWAYASITAAGWYQADVRCDVIIVLGAAVWPDGPSPALRARVDRAVELYNDGRAGALIMSGGLGRWPPAEAEVMAATAVSRGVPESVIALEPDSTNTVENLSYSRDIMRECGWETAFLVSDPFHMKRALIIARDVGVEAYPAPAVDSVLWQNDELRRYYTWREVAALTGYYLSWPVRFVGGSGRPGARSP